MVKLVSMHLPLSNWAGSLATSNHLPINRAMKSLVILLLFVLTVGATVHNPYQFWKPKENQQVTIRQLSTNTPHHDRNVYWKQPQTTKKVAARQFWTKTPSRRLFGNEISTNAPGILTAVAGVRQ